ncbi:hypothetical protein PT285_06605 [Lactobacillus sp. ESL0791]|uniref:hypothetical protein n=1 Tax=Lactobacillus sp. ESL0791 TaxID=2983234 RepID=UPI0023F8413E|nr:hypothetical protein [Lactobacillus sp. ESL0791]MDF7639070.1 hypothetical protein [Lactobacillus sp. ESL0791]
MKINRKIIILVVTSITALSPIVSFGETSAVAAIAIKHTQSKWSKNHKKADKYFKQTLRKGEKLSKQDTIKLYEKALKYFATHKEKYVGKYNDYLNSGIDRLNKEIITQRDYDIAINYPAGTTVRDEYGNEIVVTKHSKDELSFIVTTPEGESEAHTYNFTPVAPANN